MKRFKIIDCWISVILIVGAAAKALVKLDDSIFIAYFVVGGWQVISMLVHAAKGCFVNKEGTRFLYHCVVVIIVPVYTLLVLLKFEDLWPLLYLALFITPFMAIFYTWLCYHEVHVKMQRPLALLK